MEVFPNWTAVPIVFILIVLTFVLNRLFFIPLGKTIEERNRRMSGARQEAEEIRRTSQERLAEFERKMRDARREADQQMAHVKNAALQEKAGLINTRKMEVERMLFEARTDINQKKEEARKTLEKEVQSFAYRIASQILGRPIQPGK